MAGGELRLTAGIASLFHRHSLSDRVDEEFRGRSSVSDDHLILCTVLDESLVVYTSFISVLLSLP